MAVLLMNVASHSWLDCIGLASTNYTGPVQYFSDDFYNNYCIGYGRGYPGRMNRNINTLYTVQVDRKGLPDPTATRVCGNTAQGTQSYSTNFPMANVVAGTTIKLWYEMDNHKNPLTQVHLWGYKVPNREILFYSEQTNATHIMSYDYATPQNCMDMSDPNTLCWGYWTIPRDWHGKYSFLWNWRWNQNPVGEEFNTCFEIQVDAPPAY